ncbi:MAG: hypothetical protein ABI831_13065 [Betaproteobacteria bacterium]
MQALLAIPDNQRTEAEWDELNELEIKLAPGNRDDSAGSREDAGNQNKGGGRNAPGPGASPRPEGVGGGGGPRRKPARKFHKRPPKVGPP